MSAVVEVWLISSAFISGISLLIGLIGALVTSGYRDESEARFVLGCFGLTLLSLLWPVLFPAAFIRALGGLWSDADLPSVSQWIERRRIAVEVERDKRVREQAREIARLEREAGIR